VVLGLVTRAAGALSPAATAALALGTGLCGALSTYSTFSYETLRLLENGMRVAAAGNVVVTLALGSGAAALGWTAASALV
jgi:fluoride exporter